MNKEQVMELEYMVQHGLEIMTYTLNQIYEIINTSGKTDIYIMTMGKYLNVRKTYVGDLESLDKFYQWVMYITKQGIQ